MLGFIKFSGSGVPGGLVSLFFFLRKKNKTINTHLFILINITDIAICFLMVFVGESIRKYRICQGKYSCELYRVSVWIHSCFQSFEQYCWHKGTCLNNGFWWVWYIFFCFIVMLFLHKNKIKCLYFTFLWKPYKLIYKTI